MKNSGRIEEDSIKKTTITMQKNMLQVPKTLTSCNGNHMLSIQLVILNQLSPNFAFI